MRPAHDKSYFHFTRKERNGILFLTSLALFAVLASILYPYILIHTPQPATYYADDIARLEAKAPDTASKYPRYTNEYKRYKSSPNGYKHPGGELFYFDPNTLSESEWKRLGLRDKTISSIKNYLAKGGRFREATDIKKIWGLQEELAKRIIPFARITKLPEKQFVWETSFKKAYPSKTYHTIDINSGDSTVLTGLPGIGPKLSQRIIKYRDKLGGFYSVDQVSETFGLADSTFRKIRAWLQVDKENIKTININTATIEELKSHPYIRYHLANALIQYRQQHRGYTLVSEIRNIMLVDDTTYQKLAPYLTID